MLPHIPKDIPCLDKILRMAGYARTCGIGDNADVAHLGGNVAVRPKAGSGQANRLGSNVCQPYRVPADQVAGYKAERWPRASEEWLAAAKHDGMEVESILINKTKIG
jgi:hypothetical protein